MSLKDAQDLASSNALNLSNTMRITKNDTNLRWGQTLLCKLANVILNLITLTLNHKKIFMDISVSKDSEKRLSTHILRRDLEPAWWGSLIRQS